MMAGHLGRTDVSKERIKYLRAKSARLAKQGQMLSQREMDELGKFGKQSVHSVSLAPSLGYWWGDI